ncbi:MAG TPA: DNA-3-methyladenine glycosylase [Mucilaginibacter sp.]|nr:DNA-3-methyladenine glycosylase [Mucilaginibacter sp.]
MKLPESYYLQEDVVSLSKDLLGKFLFTCIDDVITGGFIVETEAYNGINDRASHAYGNRNTPRTSVMFQQGGIAYVYLCYGIHEMFNIVTNNEGIPHAILVRAIHPTNGIDVMLERRKMNVFKSNITSGPGSVAKALGISRAVNAFSLQSNTIWIEDKGMKFGDDQVAAVPRIGVDYAGEDALLPYRFYLKGDPYVSKPNK